MKLKTPNKFEMPLVQDVMQREIVTIALDTPVDEVARILTTHMISGAPVVDEEKNVLGVVSLSDLAVHASHPQAAVPQQYYRDLWLDDDVVDGFMVEGDATGVKAQDLMTPLVHQVREDDPLPEVVQLMMQARIHRVLVSNGREIVGIVTTMDLCRLLPEVLRELARHTME